MKGTFSSARSRLALSCNVSSFLGFWCGGGIGPTHGDAMSSDAQVTQSAQFLCIRSVWVNMSVVRLSDLVTAFWGIYGSVERVYSDIR